MEKGERRRDSTKWVVASTSMQARGLWACSLIRYKTDVSLNDPDDIAWISRTCYGRKTSMSQFPVSGTAPYPSPNVAKGQEVVNVM
jgi:hypothetical protein